VKNYLSLTEVEYLMTFGDIDEDVIATAYEELY